MAIRKEIRSFLDPLYNDLDVERRPKRILNDNGIRKALSLGLISTTPCFDPDQDKKRIQPATLDVKIKDVDEVAPITYDSVIDPSAEFHFPRRDSVILESRSISTINLTELLDLGQLSQKDLPRFFGVMTESRSSVRRLGIYMANCGSYFFSGPDNTTLEVGNFSPNDIRFDIGERVAQVFFTVDPFADIRFKQISGEDFSTTGEVIRSLEMGVEINQNAHIHYLQRIGHMKISPKLKTNLGKILVHASNVAYRMRKIDGGIDFSKRDGYKKEDLLEQIDISMGYTVQPFEHLVIETVESFELSDHVGILFWDNLVKPVFDNKGGRYKPKNRPGRVITNFGLIHLTDGWIDPGYNGGFSRQPKWLTGRTIYPGDAIGYGQVFFFPTGVNRSYGSASLDSQYKDKTETAFAR